MTARDEGWEREQPVIPDELAPRQRSDDPVGGADSADGDDAHEGAAHEEADPADVPAGGAGADSGAADAVRVDPDDEGAVPDESVHNAEPGVGTRRTDRD
ncbi:hypothetical protein [Microbacterium sp. XT11]|uniref:hypothetical protein n=1 Tax=Microbacterium sp. XT11 TaxID=367477 RepID=UPI0008378385|nr:hypothetical protein [Microbacterium sp. XT11]